MQRNSLPRPSAILDGQEAAKAVHWQSFIISAIKNVAMNLDVLLAIRPSQQPNVTCSASSSFQSPQTKPISVKQKSCTADLNIPFLRGWVLWEPAQFGLRGDITAHLQEKGFHPIHHRVPLRDIITGFIDGYYELVKLESANHNHIIYFKTPIAINGNKENIYRVNLAEGENPSEEAQIKNKLSTTPRAGYQTFRDNLESANNIDADSIKQLLNGRLINSDNWEMLFPIYFRKNNDLTIEEENQFAPIRLLGYQGKPITSDLDLRFIGLPIDLLDEQSCTAVFDAEIETQSLLLALEEVYQLLGKTKTLATSYDQVSKKENFVEFVKNTGYLTAFELCILFELNQAIENAFQEECSHLVSTNNNLDFTLGEIFRHGPDNRNPYGLSPYSPNEVVVVPRPNPNSENENQEHENVTLICVSGEENIAKLISIASEEKIWHVRLRKASSQTDLFPTKSTSGYLHGLMQSPSAHFASEYLAKMEELRNQHKSENEEEIWETENNNHHTESQQSRRGCFRLFSRAQPGASEEKRVEKKPCCCTLQ